MRDAVLQAQLESAKGTITRLTDALKEIEEGVLVFYQAKKDLVTREREGNHVRSRTEFGRAELTFYTLAEQILARRMGRAVVPEHVTLDPTLVGHPAPRAPRRRRAPRTTQATPVPRPPRRRSGVVAPLDNQATIQALRYITPEGRWVPAEPVIPHSFVSAPIVPGRQLNARWTVDDPETGRESINRTSDLLATAQQELRDVHNERLRLEAEAAEARERTRQMEASLNAVLGPNPTYVEAAGYADAATPTVIPTTRRRRRRSATR